MEAQLAKDAQAKVLIKTKDGGVEVDEELLKLQSVYFKGVLESSNHFFETLSKTFYVDEFELRTVKKMVEFVNTGRRSIEEDENYNFEEALELLNLSNKYLMSDLLRVMQFRIWRNIKKEHVLHLLQILQLDYYGGLAILNSKVNIMLEMIEIEDPPKPDTRMELLVWACDLLKRSREGYFRLDTSIVLD